MITLSISQLLPKPSLYPNQKYSSSFHPHRLNLVCPSALSRSLASTASSMHSNFLSRFSQSSSKPRLLKALSLTIRWPCITIRACVATSTLNPTLCFLISWKAQLNARAVHFLGPLSCLYQVALALPHSRLRDSNAIDPVIGSSDSLSLSFKVVS